VRVAHAPHGGTGQTRERTSGEPQPFGESLGAQLSGALKVELEFVGADRRHGLPVGPWKLLIAAVRHDPAPSWKKEGSVTPGASWPGPGNKILESKIDLILRAGLFQFDVVTSDFLFHL
jgi:hypothetical protein